MSQDSEEQALVTPMCTSGTIRVFAMASAISQWPVLNMAIVHD
jgi:23S rRNA G2445 N2-methylase RlmL